MINRRELFTWWRTAPAPPPTVDVAVRDRAPLLARVVEPTAIDDPEPFSLDAFYAARANCRGTP